jgi:MSHA biogenesis protein MshK
VKAMIIRGVDKSFAANYVSNRLSFMAVAIYLVGSLVMGNALVANAAAESTDEEVSSSVKLRDPTRPLSYQSTAVASEKKSWRLDSVLISSKRKLAVINGQGVKENGWIRGAQVTQIQAGKVIIVVKGEERVLTIGSDIRKTKVEG